MCFVFNTFKQSFWAANHLLMFSSSELILSDMFVFGDVKLSIVDIKVVSSA